MNKEKLAEQMHEIELSTKAVLATRKLFDYLSTEDLEHAGFDENDIEAFGELYHGIKEQVEELEINEEI